jgi:hypothetical protein
MNIATNVTVQPTLSEADKLSENVTVEPTAEPTADKQVDSLPADPSRSSQVTQLESPVSMSTTPETALINHQSNSSSDSSAVSTSVKMQSNESTLSMLSYLTANSSTIQSVPTDFIPTSTTETSSAATALVDPQCHTSAECSELAIRADLVTETKLVGASGAPEIYQPPTTTATTNTTITTTATSAVATSTSTQTVENESVPHASYSLPPAPDVSLNAVKEIIAAQNIDRTVEEEARIAGHFFISFFVI